MLRLLHAADVHLDSSLKGLPEYDGAPLAERRLATRRALENLVQLALDEQVQLLLVAGDLYDGDWTDHNTGLFFVSQMARLREAGVRVLVIRGNHDAASKMTRTLRMPDHVHVFSADGCESLALEDLGAVVHGRSFARAAEYENLALSYPAARPGMVNLGLLHTSLTGAAGHEPYAPCTVSDLESRQYDYWALGHVHHRSQASAVPPIVFPGNLQGRHFREDGPKGCELVEIDERRRVRREFRPLDVFRWYNLPLDLAHAATLDEALDLAADGLQRLLGASGELPFAVRLQTRGPSPLHAQLLAEQDRLIADVRALALELGGGRVWVESVRVETTLAAELASGLEVADGPLGELIESIQRLKDDDVQLRELAEELQPLERKLPADVAELLGCGEPAALRRLLDEIQPMLVRRLVLENNPP